MQGMQTIAFARCGELNIFTSSMRGYVVAAAFVCCAPPCVTRATEAQPVLANSRLRIEFDAKRGHIVQLTDLTTAHAFISTANSPGLWEITLGDGKHLLPSDAREFSATSDEKSVFTMKWSRFEYQNQTDAEVIAVVSLDTDSSQSRWRISVAGIKQTTLRKIAFPRISRIAPQADEIVIVPQWIGERTQQARAIVNPSPGKPARREWDYPGTLSMQFLAYYGGAGPGLMISTEDAHLLRKRFAMFGDGSKGVGFEVIHEVPNDENSTASYSLPYDVCVRTFAGDWYTAADLYGLWAHQQSWVESSRKLQHATPPWVSDTALWVWNRGTSADVLTPAIPLQEYANLPTSVFWHWWHGCSYDVGFPEYLPPREGAEPFRQAVAAAHSHGVHAIVYMNQRIWGMTTKSWTEQNAAAAAVKQPDGTIHPEIYNTFVKAPCASMCMGTPFWRNTYATLAAAAVRDFGVAGIYMDQACTSLSCYDPSHGHPLGGGAYWLAGFQELERDIRHRCAATREVALAGEGCGEGWLPHLDMMLSLQVSLERYAPPNEWEPIPLFNVVYHECATQFGNYSSLTRPPYDSLWPKEFAPTEPLALLDRKFAAQFRLEHVRSFLWGQQLTIANFQPSQLDSRRDEIDYLVKLARLRQGSLKYLRDGVFLRPPNVESPQLEIPISRLSIYAGQQEAVKEYCKRVPQILASAFRAQDGDIAIFLANIGDTTVPAKLDLAASDYPWLETALVFRQTESGRQSVGRVNNGNVQLQVSLAPAAVHIYEITPDGNATNTTETPK